MTLARNTADLSALLTAQNPDVSMSGFLSGGSATMFRNKIINGNFDIWQRATTQTISGYGSADRWYCEHVGTTKTVSQQTFTVGQTDVPNNPTFFMRHVVSSVAGAGNFCDVYQATEDVTKLAGKTVTLSFWAKADAIRNIAVDFGQRFGTGGSPSANVNFGATTFALTTAWQKFTVTVAVPSIAGKTLGTNGNSNTSVIFWFDAGSTYNSRTNSLGQQSGTFDIAQVQLEEGSIATPFESLPYELTVSLCQRYYQKVTSFNWAGYGSAGQSQVIPVALQTAMRTTPTYAAFGTFNLSNCSQGGSNGAPLTNWGFILHVVTTALGGFQIITSGLSGFAYDAEL